jgi:hypothetical protein
MNSLVSFRRDAPQISQLVVTGVFITMMDVVAFWSGTVAIFPDRSVHQLAATGTAPTCPEVSTFAVILHALEDLELSPLHCPGIFRAVPV